MPRPWAEDAEEKLLTDALDQVELADTRRASTTSGRSSTTSSRSTRTRARPRCSSRPRASAPSRSGSATASCRSRPASTTRRGSPSGSRRSTWSPAGASSSAPASRARRRSWARSASTARPSATSGRRRSTRSRGCSWRSRSRATTAAASRCRRARCCRSPSRSRTRRCGWRAAAARRSCSPRGGGSARSRSRSSSPSRRRSGWTSTTGSSQSDECVPAGFAVNPNLAVVLPMMLHQDEATAIERGIDGAHFFGYSLAHYYVFGDHRPGITNVWEEFQAKRAEYGFAREIINADDGPLGVKILQQGLGSLRGAIGTPEQVAELVERYERCGRGPGDLRAAGRARTSTSTSASRSSCSARRCCRTSPTGARSARPRSASGWRRPCERALARRAPPRAADPGYVITPTRRAAAGAGDRGRSARRAEGADGSRRRTAARHWSATGSSSAGESAFARLRARPQRRAARAHGRLERRACG